MALLPEIYAFLMGEHPLAQGVLCTLGAMTAQPALGLPSGFLPGWFLVFMCPWPLPGC